jgi:glycosyltransferase involved in cell wall biosynthesis
MSNAKSPRVSAIIPAYNEAPRILSVLELLAQCPQIDEIICVDDGSTDKTSEIVSSNYPRIKLITLEKNMGKGFAIAEGVGQARADIVLLVDADLIGLKAENIGDLLQPVILHDCDVVVGVRDYWADSIIFRSLSGERVYKRSDLIPHLTQIRDLGFRLELYLNYTFHPKRVKTVLLEGVYNPHKWQKMKAKEGVREHMKVSKEILTHIANQDSPLEYLYKACIKHFYLPFHPESFSVKTNQPKHPAFKMQSSMTISVVIPAHNEQNYIEKTLEALEKQTVKADEIIVVDNLSTDKTVEIALAHKCKVIHESKIGISHARDAGFDFARSDIIARTDADTIPDMRWIENIKNHMAHGAQAVTGPVYFDITGLRASAHAVEAFMLLLKLIFGHSVWFGANMALRKDLWIRVRGQMVRDDKKVHEDAELAIAVSNHADIQYRKDVAVTSSSRRMRNDPKSFFVEYQVRLLKMATRVHGKRFRKYFEDISKYMNQQVFSSDW